MYNKLKETKDYFEKHLKYVSNQSTKQAINVLVSLMQNNALERLKEQVHAKRDSLDDNQKVEELDNILSSPENLIKIA